jgi:hydroxymethylbilane synthase
MSKIYRIGTRDSKLAVWQSTLVKDELARHHVQSELVFIKTDGDIDLVTPVYEIGIQGVFTKTLDTALLNDRIDIAVHSMKDVPTQLPEGIAQAAVLPRASFKDILVYKGERSVISKRLRLVNGQWLHINGETQNEDHSSLTIATSSIRRKAQWLHRYPNHLIEAIRGNVNTRLNKLQTNKWDAVIFAAAGLERLHIRPETSIELDWMLPAPAQGAIMIACRADDLPMKKICKDLDDEKTALCTKIERDFLRTLMGGCSTPISALAQIRDDKIYFRGNIFSLNGKEKIETEMIVDVQKAMRAGIEAAEDVWNKGGKKLTEAIRDANK